MSMSCRARLEPTEANQRRHELENENAMSNLFVIEFPKVKRLLVPLIIAAAAATTSRRGQSREACYAVDLRRFPVGR